MPKWPFEVQDPTHMTDADWAELNKLKAAYESGGEKALSKALAELGADPVCYVSVIGALIPEVMGEKLRDALAARGLTEEDLAEMLREAERRLASPSQKKHNSIAGTGPNDTIKQAAQLSTAGELQRKSVHIANGGSPPFGPIPAVALHPFNGGDWGRHDRVREGLRTLLLYGAVCQWNCDTRSDLPRVIRTQTAPSRRRFLYCRCRAS